MVHGKCAQYELACKEGVVDHTPGENTQVDTITRTVVVLVHLEGNIPQLPPNPQLCRSPNHVHTKTQDIVTCL